MGAIPVSEIVGLLAKPRTGPAVYLLVTLCRRYIASNGSWNNADAERLVRVGRDSRERPAL